MKRAFLYFLLIVSIFVFFESDLSAEKKIDLTLFYSSSCKHCIDIKDEFLPGINSKYKDRINAEYLNTAEEKNFKLLLLAEQRFKVKARVPAILIGNYFLVGQKQIKSELENIIRQYVPAVNSKVDTDNLSLRDKFHTFSTSAIIVAGLIDGINPCAFTVIIFFISFLTLMGYKKKELAIVGLSFNLAVFLTYLMLGLGLFKGLYELKQFHVFIRLTYFIMACLCFILAYLNLRDFFAYRKTKNPDSLKVRLPKSVRNRINSIIGMFYRRGQKDPSPPYLILILTALVVGILISLLEALCTGQIYLPTIVFILKEPTLRLKAVFYLVLYNIMFITPLMLILVTALLGMSSEKIEKFFRDKIALVKLFMFILFLGLGVFLLTGI